MDIKNFSNADLLLRFGKLVRTERKITHLVLECISEIDRRKIYAEKAYPSLFEYLVGEFGYSSSAAGRRIASARLLREIPKISQKIESGALNMSQLSKVQQVVRIVEKTEDRKVSTFEKTELLKKIENVSQQKTEVILAQEFSLPLITEEKIKNHHDESITLTLRFSKEEISKLREVQDLVAHSVPDKKWTDLFLYLAQKEVKRRTESRKKSSPETKIFSEDLNTASSSNACTSVQQQSKTKTIIKKETKTNISSDDLTKSQMGYPISFRKNPKSILRKPIPIRLRKNIFQKDQCCQFKDPQSGKVCGSTRLLQVDHIQSVWNGGSNDPQNLQMLCSQHNRWKYQKEAQQHPLRI